MTTYIKCESLRSETMNNSGYVEEIQGAIEDLINKIINLDKEREETLKELRSKQEELIEELDGSRNKFGKKEEKGLSEIKAEKGESIRDQRKSKTKKYTREEIDTMDEYDLKNEKKKLQTRIAVLEKMGNRIKANQREELKEKRIYLDWIKEAINEREQ